EVEILTTDNHADGVYLLHYVEQHFPERADEVRQLLRMHGGCSAGTKMSNVDPKGNVHACQFWGHRVLGNVRERKFSDIWRDSHSEFLELLRHKPEHVKGRCAECQYNDVCGGCRIRAEVVHGDTWAEDPACYLTDEEIGRLPKAANQG
ncbi:MAG TPA: SPASM domain-containing protein, partial [Firmicutes bacterium]|nr:SPASM domain-containing protein [Bacillota bacterium]